jgi:hypothetical protein
MCLRIKLDERTNVGIDVKSPRSKHQRDFQGGPGQAVGRHIIANSVDQVMAEL